MQYALDVSAIISIMYAQIQTIGKPNKKTSYGVRTQ